MRHAVLSVANLFRRPDFLYPRDERAGEGSVKTGYGRTFGGASGRVLTSALVAAFLAVVAPAASGAVLTVPGQYPSLGAAYLAAQPGDAVEVSGGSYGLQEIGPSTRPGPIVFRPALGQQVALAGLSISGVSDVEVQDMTTAGWAVESTDDVTLRRVTSVNPSGSAPGGFLRDDVGFRGIDLEIGPIDPGDGLQIWPPLAGQRHISDLRFDGLWMHDLSNDNEPEYHTDCVQIADGSGVVFNRSRFYNCATQGLYASADFGGGVIDGVTVENSFLGQAQLGFYSMHLRAQGEDFMIRNNTFTSPVYIQDVTGVTVTGNVFAQLSGLQLQCPGRQVGVLV
jgi:hypothetical protein